MKSEDIAKRIVEYVLSTDRADAVAVVQAEIEGIVACSYDAGLLAAVDVMRKSLCDHIEDSGGYVGCCVEEHIRAALEKR